MKQFGEMRSQVAHRCVTVCRRDATWNIARHYSPAAPRRERGRESNFRCNCSTMAVQIEFARWQFHCAAVYHPRETAISISLCATNIISLRRMIDRSCSFVKRRWLAHIQLLFTAAAAIDDRLRMKECPQKNDTLRQCNMSLSVTPCDISRAEIWHRKSFLRCNSGKLFEKYCGFLKYIKLIA